MSKYCSELHKIVNKMERFEFPFNREDIPKNGLYILFEKNELGHDGDRIVRIGTHTGQSQLRSRLKQHFMNENKDRSIFRKNIGRALLNKDKNIAPKTNKLMQLNKRLMNISRNTNPKPLIMPIKAII